jgi:hypothetical protein
MAPLKIGVSLELGCIYGSSLDEDAAAYIAAVEAAGATVTGAQRTFINNFYKSAKADYYTSLKRLYLPIWGVAAANAIDMITLASGTFAGGVTHASGYVQGNGSTGYFDFGATYSGLSMGQSDAHIAAGRITNNAGVNSCLIGARPAGLSTCYIATVSGAISTRGNCYDDGGASLTALTGIFVSNITSPTSGYLYNLSNAGSTNATDATVGGTIPTTTNIHAMRRNWASADIYDSGRHIFWSAGPSMTNASVANYASHMRTLWEGCTGLTLP